MYKATYKDIKWLIDSDFADEVRDIFKDRQPQGYEVAYYTPSGANWSYRILLTTAQIMGKPRVFEVVTVFGEVKGGRELHQLNYQLELQGEF